MFQFRYVFPAELLPDHLIFYSKYGHTYNANSGHLKEDHANQQFEQQTTGNKDFLENELLEKELHTKSGEHSDAEPKNELSNEKLVNKTDHSTQRSKLEQNESEEERMDEKAADKLNESSDGRSSERLNEKSGEKSSEKLNEKLNEKLSEKLSNKSDEKSNERSDEPKEPDEAATNLFKSWKINSKNLYNFGSCTPIYDLGQTNIPNMYASHQARSSRWPLFG